MPVCKIVCLATLVVLLSSCGYGRVEYFYFDFANGDIDASDWQEPEVWFYKGDKVPRNTKIDWDGETVQILNVNRCCVPFLEIRSPVPLSNIIVTNGKFVSDYDDLLGASCVAIQRRGEDAALLAWGSYAREPEPSCIRVGNQIFIKLVPENESEPLVLSAVLVRSGHYRISTF